MVSAFDGSLFFKSFWSDNVAFNKIVLRFYSGWDCRSPAGCRLLPLFNCGTHRCDAAPLQAKPKDAGMGFGAHDATATPCQENVPQT